MTTLLMAGLLVVHGLNHLLVWLPRVSLGTVGRVVFVSDQTESSPAVTLSSLSVRRLAEAAAVGTAAAFVLAGVAVALGSSQAVPLAVVGACAGLFLKAPHFHTRLVVGAVVDLLVLAVALDGWPIPLVQA